jgi:tetratricopeptide (TPR) repeat protein/tRNA A-37 threonylcarbamoyl transferase component Bud32
MAERPTPTQLVEELRAEQRVRWQKGDAVYAEVYLRDHPVLQADPNCALKLVYQEVLLREARGESPQLEEYLGRFPQYEAQLRPLFAVHRAIESSQWLDLSLADTPLRGPVSEAAETAGVPSVPGYQILGKLGQGGMGVVYKARHERLNREVALKMILTGTHASAEELARFRAEAEAQARVQHPNIVQIYEVGETAGCPYFALEYVDGQSLHDKLRAGPLSARTAAQLIEILARAVEHAHQRGLVHRDLKPANVLLTANDTPKITDFGLAKRLKAEGYLSQSGAIIGTPSYMAPEQTTVGPTGVGPLVDVYALGVILYETLTGRPPFLAETTLDTLLQVRSLDPVPPRRLQPKVPRDLETICLKCLQKDPAKRYASAEALADDLLRFQSGAPIRARPVGGVERLWRWCRRKPAVAGLALALGAGLTLAIVSLVVLVAVMDQARRRSIEEQARTEEARQVAVTARKRARAALDEVGSQAINTLLTQQTALTEAHKAFLRKMLALYQDFAEEADSSPEARAEVVTAHGYMGNIRQRLGEYAEAEIALSRAHKLCSQLVNEFPSMPQYRAEMAKVENNLGNYFYSVGHPTKAERAHRNALAIRQELVDNFPGEPEYRNDLAKSLNNLGTLSRSTGRWQEAEQLYRKAILILDKLVNDFPAVPEHRLQLAESQSNLCVVLSESGSPGDVEQLYRIAVAILQNLVNDFPTVAEYRNILAYRSGYLAEFLAHHGSPQAEQVSRDALAIQQKLVADFPAVPHYRARLTDCHRILGRILLDTGRPQEAEQSFRDALAIQKKLADDYPTVSEYRDRLARSYNWLGIVLKNTDRLQEAEQAYGDALAIQQKLVSDFPDVPGHRATLVRIHNNLGVLLRKAGRPKEAEEASRRAIELMRKLADDFPEVPDYQNEMAAMIFNQALLSRDRRDLTEARDLLKQAEPYHRKAVNSDPRNVTYRRYWRMNRRDLAQLLARLGEHTAAAQTADELISIAFQPGDNAYDAACVFSQCSSIAEHDPVLSIAMRQAVSQIYADRSLELLRQAIAQGYKDVAHIAHMKKDKDLDPLRSRPDFQELLKSLEPK